MIFGKYYRISQKILAENLTAQLELYHATRWEEYDSAVQHSIFDIGCSMFLFLFLDWPDQRIQHLSDTLHICIHKIQWHANEISAYVSLT